MTKQRQTWLDQIEPLVEVYYLNRFDKKFWNSKRASGEPSIFTGWYWTNNQQECGPFKSKSAALRDAYYKQVLHRTPPSMHQETLLGASFGKVVPFAQWKKQA